MLGVERRWNDAITSRDAATTATILAEDFVFIAPNGMMIGKSDLLRIVADRNYRLEPITTTDVDVRTWGEVAVVTGRFEQRGTYRGHARPRDLHLPQGG